MSVKNMYQVLIENPKVDNETVTMFGVAASINIAISKSKKKLKENLGMESEQEDLIVVSAIHLHPVEF